MTTLCGTDGKVYQIDRDIRAGTRQARVRVEVRLGETTAGQFQHAAGYAFFGSIAKLRDQVW